MGESVAILIPTRNRPNHLANLLRSITLSTIKPIQVVVVASGQNVESVIYRFRESLQITYRHTETKGQIAQKRIGLELISKEIEWCLFLDDDLILGDSAIISALSGASAYRNTDIIGIGLSVAPSSRSLGLSNWKLKLLQLFKLSSNSPGQVLASGHATSYLQENTLMETQWLNGTSMWRVEHAKDYGKGLPSTPYAACEDLIFSYPLSKKGKLIYVPYARVEFQDTERTQFDSFEVFKAATLWRYYFVTQHRELSFHWFILSQVVRSLYTIKRAKYKKINLFLDLLKLNVKIVNSYINNVSPLILLSQLKN